MIKLKILGGGNRVNIVVGVQSRLSSKRLPGKALLKLSNTSVLGMTLSRCKLLDYPTYLLTSNRNEDELLIKEAFLNNIDDVIRGSLDNVLSRFILLSEKVKPDFIVRVTADNPLTEFRFIKPLISYMKEINLPYCWVDPYKCADGTNLEVFTPEFLIESQKRDNTAVNKEHVTAWMRRKVGKSSYVESNGLEKIIPSGSSEFHFGIDTFDDYIKVQNIVNFTELNTKWQEPDFTYKCITNVIKKKVPFPKGRRHFP